MSKAYIFLLSLGMGLAILMGNACQPVNGFREANNSMGKIDSLENAYKGLWRLHSVLIHFPDTTVDLMDCLPTSSVYHIGPKRFTVMFFGDKGTLLNAAYGNYILENDSTFVENIDFHTNSALTGNQVRFNTEIDSNKWIKSAMLPVTNIECLEEMIQGYSTPHFLWEEVRVKDTEEG